MQTQVLPIPNRWWIYQRERFPLVAHGSLVAAFSFSAVSYSSLLRGDVGLPQFGAIVVAFLTAFLFFLQLRIADEFKDSEEDARYRPYRPVPRGLVRLQELAAIGVGGAVVQLGLALWFFPTLALLLLCVWIYLSLMCREFFLRAWLKARPITYLWSHMLIMPMIDLYATACDWLVAGAGLPTGLYWFLFVSFSNGVVIEIGRKIRAPGDEEPGVETYSALWGRRNAVIVWIGAMVLTMIFALIAAQQIDFLVPVSFLLAVSLCTAIVVSLRFLWNPVTNRAKLIEQLSGLWTLLMYLSLGALPLIWSL